MPEISPDNQYWLISRDELFAWLNDLAHSRTLIAPRLEGDVLLFKQVTNCKEIHWHALTTVNGNQEFPVLSCKEYFFPQTETLFSGNFQKDEFELEETFPSWENVIFGLRPCDARGLKILDAVYIGTEPIDPYYFRRRENTALIGLTCQQLGPSCFCTSVGGNPLDGNDFDISITETKQGFVVSSNSNKGKFLISEGSWSKATSIEREKEDFNKFTILEKNSWPKHFHDELWEKISEACLSCRICAYVCPTCRCFITKDEMLGSDNFQRLRCWDSCTGENYRLAAGGHRPRAEKVERLRNRFFCKFNYFPEQYDLSSMSACTGCGRCIDACPLGIDITEILKVLEQ